MRPEKDWYDLGALVDEVVGPSRGVSPLRTRLTRHAGGLAAVVFDYVEIDQVLTNLIENAIKYTPPGAEIAVIGPRA